MCFSTYRGASEYAFVRFFYIFGHFLFYASFVRELIQNKKCLKIILKGGGPVCNPFTIACNIISCGLSNLFIIYQQNMIMSFVNTKIISKHCDAMIFFPHTQRVIYHFKDNYGSRMFFMKGFNSIFDMPRISRNACIFISNPFTP